VNICEHKRTLCEHLLYAGCASTSASENRGQLSSLAEEGEVQQSWAVNLMAWNLLVDISCGIPDAVQKRELRPTHEG